MNENLTLKEALIPSNVGLMLQESMTRMNKIAESARKNVLDRSAILHDLSVELSYIGSKKLYEQTHHKSLADFALELYGIEKSMTYTLSRAGDVYRDDKIPDSVKALPPTTVSQFSAVTDKKDREELFKKVEDGEILTQKEVREAISATKTEKPKTPKFYKFWVDGYNPIFATNITVNSDFTIKYPDETEYIPVGKISPFPKFCADTEVSLYAVENAETHELKILHVVQLSKTEYTKIMEELSKPQPMTKAERRAQLLKQLEELGEDEGE